MFKIIQNYFKIKIRLHIKWMYMQFERNQTLLPDLIRDIKLD